MFKNKLQTGFTLAICLVSGIAFASTKLPTFYPSHFEIAGKITAVLKQARVIELDGTAYKLQPVHDIYTRRKGIQATLYDLRPGMKVGLEYTNNNGKKLFNKVWILPKDYPSTKHTH